MPTHILTQPSAPRVSISGGQSDRAATIQTATSRNCGSPSPCNSPETAPVGEKMVAKRAGRLETTPESAKGHFVAAWAGKCSPRRAIKAQCLECVAFDRQEIADCTNWACALWHFRPFQTLSKVAAFDAAPSVETKTSMADRQRDTAKLRKQ
jgi:hypothetical protein